VREQALRTGSIFEGCAHRGERPAGWNASSGSADQAAWSGNTVNPRVGCGLQQRPRRQAGENRRGGEKPRGRNGTCAGGTAGPKAPSFGTAPGVDSRHGDRRRGPRGGDATESPDEAGLDVHSCMPGASRLQRAGRPGSAKDSGGRPGARARAGRDVRGKPPRAGGTTPREHGCSLRAAAVSTGRPRTPDR
jgi:hypothetical protein